VAGGQERALRRRIRSIESTKKITRAMELIAASRIIRAQQRVEASRPYARYLTEVLHNLAAAGGNVSAHPLLQAPNDGLPVGVIVVAADRGLAGGYNANVLRAAERAIQEERRAGRDYRLIVSGRKAESYFRFKRYRIDAAFHGFSEQPTYENARSIAAEVLSRFEAYEIGRAELVYTQFLSVGSQRVVNRRFIPVPVETLTEGAEGGIKAGYEFEPSPENILTLLLPSYVEARLFDALLEAAASEHAARQRAMKSATDNASTLITNLTRVMNRARQESITTEIMEIVGGAEALAQESQSSEE
jgi:F-type H+-transporting ATPase subunit gamma